MRWDDSTSGADLQICPEKSEFSTGYGLRSGDRYAPGIETAGSRSTGEKSRNENISTISQKLPLSGAVSERIICKRRLYLKACLEAFDRIHDCEDPILKANAVNEVKNNLQALWEKMEGNPNSEAFEEIVNVLQIAFADDDANSLDRSQLEILESVIVAHSRWTGH